MRKKKTDMTTEMKDVMFSKSATEADFSSSALKIIPLGGLEQIGMNITAFEFGDSIIVVDCGLAFPQDEMLDKPTVAVVESLSLVQLFATPWTVTRQFSLSITKP